MTVRAWFTISALVLAALAAAFAFRLFAPTPVPEIIVRVGDRRIEGALERFCWPQRNALRCGDGEEREPEAATIPPSGSFRFVVTSPAQPREGSITLTDARTGRRVLGRGWTRTLRYELGPGRYTLDVTAGDTGGAFVDYTFELIVTRSGS